MTPYKLFVITSQSCPHCDHFKENMHKYERIWSKYPNLQVVKIDSSGGFDPGAESGNLKGLVRWSPTLLLIDKKEYDRTRGFPGYRYEHAYIYGSNYSKDNPELRPPSVALTPEGFERFLQDSIDVEE